MKKIKRMAVQTMRIVLVVCLIVAMMPQFTGKADEYGTVVTLPGTDPAQEIWQSDSGVKNVSIGDFHTLMITNDGRLWAWGKGQYGRLGLGNENNVTSPTQIGTASNWVMVSAGQEFSAAINDKGELWMWGRNYRGQLGDESNTDRLTPVQVGTDTNWHTVSAGGQHTAAIKNFVSGQGGELWSWGQNDQGGVGTGNNTSYNTPQRIGSDNTWWQVSAGGYTQSGWYGDFTTALKMDGSLWTWGWNASGQLGNGTQNTTNILGIDNADFNTKTPAQIAIGQTFRYINAGTMSAFAIDDNNQLWGWGENSQAQLGMNTGSAIDTNNKNTPQQLFPGVQVRYVSGGRYHTAASTMDGSLYVWGTNQYNQMSLDTTPVVANNAIGIGQITGDYIYVIAGWNNTGVIKADGSLWMVGNNASGSVGVGNTTDPISSFSLVIPSLAIIQQPEDVTISGSTEGNINVTTRASLFDGSAVTINTVNYNWYKTTDPSVINPLSDTPVGTNDAALDLSLFSDVGTYYFYVIVSDPSGNVASVTSDVVTFIREPGLTITTQPPGNLSFISGRIPVGYTITVDAESMPIDNNLTFQWYYTGTGDVSGGVPINETNVGNSFFKDSGGNVDGNYYAHGATTNTLTIPQDLPVGDFGFYAVITSGLDPTMSITSAITMVTITAPPTGDLNNIVVDLSSLNASTTDTGSVYYYYDASGNILYITGVPVSGTFTLIGNALDGLQIIVVDENDANSASYRDALLAEPSPARTFSYSSVMTLSLNSVNVTNNSTANVPLNILKTGAFTLNLSGTNTITSTNANAINIAGSGLYFSGGGTLNAASANGKGLYYTNNNMSLSSSAPTTSQQTAFPTIVLSGINNPLTPSTTGTMIFFDGTNGYIVGNLLSSENISIANGETYTVSGSFTNSGIVSIASGGILNTAMGMQNASINNTGTFTNKGTISITSGFVFNNNGNIQNTGTTAAINNSGTINNASGKTLSNEAGAKIANAGTITNNGTLQNNISGPSSIINDATINNNGTLQNIGTQGAITNNSTINNTGAIVSSGGGSSVTNASNAQIINTGGSSSTTPNPLNFNITSGSFSNSGTISVPSGSFLSLYGTAIQMVNSGVISNAGFMYTEKPIQNTGSIENKSGATFENAGNISMMIGSTLTNAGVFYNGLNDGTIGSLNQNSGSITNDGSFYINRPLSVASGYTFTNNGTMYVNASGVATINGTLANNSGAVINNTGSINVGMNASLNSMGVINISGGFFNNSGAVAILGDGSTTGLMATSGSGVVINNNATGTMVGTGQITGPGAPALSMTVTVPVPEPNVTVLTDSSGNMTITFPSVVDKDTSIPPSQTVTVTNTSGVYTGLVTALNPLSPNLVSLTRTLSGVNTALTDSSIVYTNMLAHMAPTGKTLGSDKITLNDAGFTDSTTFTITPSAALTVGIYTLVLSINPTVTATFEVLYSSTINLDEITAPADGDGWTLREDESGNLTLTLDPNKDFNIVSNDGIDGNLSIVNANPGAGDANVTVSPSLNVNNGGSITVGDGVIINLPNGSELNVEGDLVNNGTINNDGTINIDGGDLSNNGTINNDTTVPGDGIINIVGGGNLTNNGGGLIVNGNGKPGNPGDVDDGSGIINIGDGTLIDDGALNNLGTLTNNPDGTINVNNGGSITGNTPGGSGDVQFEITYQDIIGGTTTAIGPSSAVRTLFGSLDDVITLNAGAINGYAFKQWTTNTAGVTITNPTSATGATFIMPGVVVNITAEWVVATSGIAFDDATISKSLDFGTVDYGYTVNGSSLNNVNGQSISLINTGNADTGTISVEIKIYGATGTPTRFEPSASMFTLSATTIASIPANNTVIGDALTPNKIVQTNVLTLTPVAGLPAGTFTATITLRAANASENPIEINVTFTVVAVVPGAPNGASASAGDSSAALSWGTPVDDGGAEILYYTIEYSTDGGSTWTTWTTNPVSGPATITGLTNGTNYLFRVSAVNVSGTGAPYVTNAVKPSIQRVITFDYNNAITGANNAASATTAPDNEDYTLPVAIPTAAGYRFVSWALNGTMYAPGDVVSSAVVTSDLTFVAQWVQTFTVSFDADGGTPIPSVQVIDSGSMASPPNPPSKTGFNFVSWQLNGIDYNFAAPITGNITLVSVWQAVVYPVLGVSVSPTSASVSVQSSILLTATINPANAGNQAVVWSSSDPSIATVDAAGLVLGVRSGMVIITVTTSDGNKSADATITVSDLITLDVSAAMTSEFEGYTNAAPPKVAVTNIGAADLTLTLTLSGADAAHFTINSTSVLLAADGTYIISIVPNDGLPVGVYHADLNIAYNPVLTVPIVFTVQAGSSNIDFPMTGPFPVSGPGWSYTEDANGNGTLSLDPGSDVTISGTPNGNLDIINTNPDGGDAQVTVKPSLSTGDNDITIGDGVHMTNPPGSMIDIGSGGTINVNDGGVLINEPGGTIHIQPGPPGGNLNIGDYGDFINNGNLTGNVPGPVETFDFIITPRTATIYAGSGVQLVPVFNIPQTDVIVWQSSDPAIAYVSAASGYVVGVSPGTVQITASMGLIMSSPAAITVVLAPPQDNNDGDDNDDDSETASSPPSVKTPPAPPRPPMTIPAFVVNAGDDKPDVSDEIFINIVTDDHIAQVDISELMVNKLIELAHEKALASDGTVPPVLVLDLTGLPTIDTIALPRDVVHAVTQAGVMLQINFAGGSVMFDVSSAQCAFDKTEGPMLYVQLARVDAANLSNAQSTQIHDDDIIFDITVHCGRHIVTEFTGLLTIRVPYEGMTPAAVYYLDHDGNLTFMPSEYDAATGDVIFQTNHLSYYVISYIGTHSEWVQLTIGSVTFLMNNHKHFMDTAPFIMNNRVMVPLKFIADALSATYSWNEALQQVTLHTTILEHTFTIGVLVPGMDAAPVIVNDRTYVPLRYISEAFGANVYWREDEQMVEIIK